MITLAAVMENAVVIGILVRAAAQPRHILILILTVDVHARQKATVAVVLVV